MRPTAERKRQTESETEWERKPGESDEADETAVWAATTALAAEEYPEGSETSNARALHARIAPRVPDGFEVEITARRGT